MFCDSCGATLQVGQGYCSRCGKAIIGAVTSEAGRVARHAQLLGILWIAYSAVILIGGGVLMVLAHTLFAHMGRMLPPGAPPPPPGVPLFLRPLLSFIAMVLFVKALAGIIAGVGILQRQEWSRVLAIVVACVSLISVPFGTALGIYTLWVLLSPNAEVEMRTARAGAR